MKPILILGALLISAQALGQNFPPCDAYQSNRPCIALADAPTPKPLPSHAFLDGPNVAAFFSSASVIGAEAGMNCNNQGPQLSPRICRQIEIGAGATLAGEILAAGVLHKTGHHSWERTSGIGVVLFHVGRMAWISTHRR